MKNAEKRQSEINEETYKTNVTNPKTKDELYTEQSQKRDVDRNSNRY